MKISKVRLVKIIQEELEYLSQKQDGVVEDLVYELTNILGREPTEEEIYRIVNSVLRGNYPNRGEE